MSNSSSNINPPSPLIFFPMRIYLGTKSNLKKEAIENVLRIFKKRNLLQAYELVCLDIKSKVPVTPFNEQTMLGARNRVQSLYERYKSEGDIFIGLESGLVERAAILFEECWCVIYNKEGTVYCGYSSGYALPKKVVHHLRGGGEHTDVIL